MTAQSLAGKNKAFYNFKPYFMHKFRSLRSMFIMNCIFALLSYPALATMLNIYIRINDNYRQTVYDDNAYTWQVANGGNDVAIANGLTIAAAVICVICLVGLFVFTLVTTVKAFRYLYNKNVVDMDYSLPVDHNTRFFGDLLAVFSASILPHIAAVILGFAIIGMLPAESAFYSSDFLTNSVDIFRKCMLTGLLSCVMQISFTLVTISFCGRIAESVIYPVLLNFAVPVIHELGAFIVGNCFYGSNFGTDTYLTDIGMTSPLGMILTAAGFHRFYYLVPAIITVLLLAASYFIIGHRQTYRVGMSYVYKGMSIIIPGIVMLAITMPLFFMVWRSIKGFGSTVNYYSYTPSPADAIPWIIGAVISTFILYIIAELIGGRSFRRFHITLAKWAGTLAVCFGITTCLYLSDGMGQKYYVPQTDDIERVSFSVESPELNLSGYGYFNYVSSDDPYVISTSTKIHELVCHYDYSDAEKTDNRVGMYYSLKDGSTVSRSYYISDSVYDQIMDAVSTPQWCAAAIKSGFTVYPGAEYIIEGVRLNGEVISSGNRSKVDIDALLAAIDEDSSRANRELMFNQNDEEIYTVVLITAMTDRNTDYGIINISPWMTNTLKVIGVQTQ